MPRRARPILRQCQTEVRFALRRLAYSWSSSKTLSCSPHRGHSNRSRSVPNSHIAAQMNLHTQQYISPISLGIMSGLQGCNRKVHTRANLRLEDEEVTRRQHPRLHDDDKDPLVLQLFGVPRFVVDQEP